MFNQETSHVRLLVSWAGRTPGYEFTHLDKRTADLLIEQGRAELVTEGKKSVPKTKRKRKSSTSGTADAGGSEATPADSSD